MKDLQDVTERICDLKGSLVALDTLLSAMLLQMPAEQRAAVAAAFRVHAEVARTVLLHASISERTLASFEQDVGRMASLMADPAATAGPGAPPAES